MHWLHGFLVGVFIIHCVAFTVLAVRRKKNYYFALTGTFIFLTVIYVIKFQSWTIAVPGTDFSFVLVLRIFAIACTATYLIWISKVPGTWLSRLLGRG